MDQRELTFGEKAVGLNFNPANNQDVQELKELYAKIIDKHDAILKNVIADGADGERIRLHKIAITEAQGAQMWSVKAATWGL